ncbi:hypothetical protein X777_00817 [Ooceraea biroi]|uniref:Uncharacterized protein n=1 Tax=Ooceraea biroi TaxID=2015173 RepID=A0A026WNT4_OOCBI|nr:hypothetical protein X777_00817 [Ooceraea biroi]
MMFLPVGTLLPDFGSPGEPERRIGENIRQTVVPPAGTSITRLLTRHVNTSRISRRISILR